MVLDLPLEVSDHAPITVAVTTLLLNLTVQQVYGQQFQPAHTTRIFQVHLVV
jgi:hypothetical protein